jgi:hypothetical protein
MLRPNSQRVVSRDAERYFPVRIRVARDRLGRERQYDDMRRWLDANIGPRRYWFGGERLPPLPDTMLFYFVTVAEAQAFVDRFACGVWIAGEWPHGRASLNDENYMRWVGEMHKTPGRGQ